MNTFLHQLVAVVTTLVLALPPGFCGGLVRHSLADTTPVKASCCHRAAPDHPSDSKKAPAQPGFQCCCSRDARLVEKPVQQTDAPDLSLPVAADYALVLGSVPGGKLVPAPDHFGPHLHVLHCVWRC
ncbi:MAG: hypothetical protein NTY19_00915 [Planctomycetota bacterium]|nr:hypothetical protein [Planctomycetota bacterium]